MRHLLVLVTLLAAAADVRASCAFEELGPRVLTTRVTALPDDGGVLVGYAPSSELADGTSGDPSVAPGWVARSKSGTVAVTRTTLAPGLTLYKLAGSAAVTIKTKAGKPVGSFTHASKTAPAALAAPEPSSLATKTAPSFRSVTTTSTLGLSHAPPPEAVAVIVYRVDPSGTTPITFATLPDTHDKLTSLGVYEGGGHCALPIPGEAPARGGKYTVAYVDAFGRLSPQSKPVSAK